MPRSIEAAAVLDGALYVVRTCMGLVGAYVEPYVGPTGQTDRFSLVSSVVLLTCVASGDLASRKPL